MTATEERPAAATAGEQVARQREAEGERHYTVAQLVRELGGLLTPRQVKRWTAEGLLPSPQRRVPPGATDGVVRAIYPTWTVHVVAEILQERARGAKLTDLQAGTAERIARWRDDPLVKPGAALDQARQAPPAITRALQRAAWEYAELYARLHHLEIPRGVSLVFHDGQGGTRGVGIAPPPGIRRLPATAPDRIAALPPGQRAED